MGNEQSSTSLKRKGTNTSILNSSKNYFSNSNVNEKNENILQKIRKKSLSKLSYPYITEKDKGMIKISRSNFYQKLDFDKLIKMTNQITSTIPSILTKHNNLDLVTSGFNFNTTDADAEISVLTEVNKSIQSWIELKDEKQKILKKILQNFEENICGGRNKSFIDDEDVLYYNKKGKDFRNSFLETQKMEEKVNCYYKEVEKLEMNNYSNYTNGINDSSATGTETGTESGTTSHKNYLLDQNLKIKKNTNFVQKTKEKISQLKIINPSSATSNLVSNKSRSPEPISNTPSTTRKAIDSSIQSKLKNIKLDIRGKMSNKTNTSNIENTSNKSPDKAPEEESFSSYVNPSKVNKNSNRDDIEKRNTNNSKGNIRIEDSKYSSNNQREQVTTKSPIKIKLSNSNNVSNNVSNNISNNVSNNVSNNNEIAFTYNTPLKKENITSTNNSNLTSNNQIPSMRKIIPIPKPNNNTKSPSNKIVKTIVFKPDKERSDNTSLKGSFITSNNSNNNSNNHSRIENKESSKKEILENIQKVSINNNSNNISYSNRGANHLGWTANKITYAELLKRREEGESQRNSDKEIPSNPNKNENSINTLNTLNTHLKKKSKTSATSPTMSPQKSTKDFKLIPKLLPTPKNNLNNSTISKQNTGIIQKDINTIKKELSSSLIVPKLNTGELNKYSDYRTEDKKYNNINININELNIIKNNQDTIENKNRNNNVNNGSNNGNVNEAQYQSAVKINKITEKRYPTLESEKKENFEKIENNINEEGVSNPKF
jgi:hypothetical protein